MRGVEVRRARVAAVVLATALGTAALPARGERATLASAFVDERLDAVLPLDAPLRDERGRVVTLREFVVGGPALLALGYYHCATLCGLLFEGTARSVAAFEGAVPALPAWRIVSLSIDPRDDPARALQAQQKALAELEWPPQRWPFLTGDEQTVGAIAQAAGFHYAYDARSDQYAHPAVLIALTPAGHVSSYLYGIEFAAPQLASALRSAAAGETHSALQRVLLRCFHYLPALREHGPAIRWSLRAVAAASLLGLALVVVRLGRRSARRGAR